MTPENLFPTKTTVIVENTEKFGLPKFMQSIVESLSISTIPKEWLRENNYSYLHESRVQEKIKKIGLNFFSRIETDYETLLQRQDFVKWFFANKEFIDFLLTTPVPLKHRNHSYPEIDDVLGLRNYVSKLLVYLKGHPYSLPFVKKTKKDLTHFTQIDNLITYCDSIKISGILCLKKNEGQYNFDTKNLVLKLVGKRSKYLLNIIDYASGHVNSRGCVFTHNGGEGKIPYVILQAMIEKVFSLYAEYSNNLQKLSANATGKVTFNFEISKIDFKSAQCTMVINGFNKEYVLYPIIVPGSNFHDQTIDFSVLEHSNIKNCRIATDFYPMNYLVEIPGKEFARGSKGFMNKIADTLDTFLKAHFLEELHLLATVANYLSLTSNSFIFPKIIPKEEMRIKSNISRNPLFIEMSKSVSNDVMLNGKVSSIVIYGANTGGKTSYANMIVMNQVFAQTGLPIFARSSEISIKDNILLHYKEGNEIAPNQSIYQAELSRLKELLEKVTKYSLVVFDEAFTGTEMRAGSKKLKDVITVLSELGCHFIVTTHFHNLISFVDTLPNVENSHFKLPDLNGGKILNYKLQPGGTRKSFGSMVASRQGLDIKSMRKLIKDK